MNTKKKHILTTVLVTTGLLLPAGALLAANNHPDNGTGYANPNRTMTHQTQTTPTPQTKTLPEDQLTLSLEGYGNTGALTDQNLTITDMLTYALQDEYTARAEYAAILDQLDARAPYQGIQHSEEGHIRSLATLSGTYGIALPEDTSPEHIAIPATLLEAALTGVQAEQNNIAMYERFLKADLPEDIRTVFENLKTASEHHLAAFQAQVEKLS